MEPGSPEEVCRTSRRVPMAQTVFWIFSLPLRLPSWLLVAAGGEILRRLHRSLWLAFSSRPTLTRHQKRTAVEVVHAGGQTELSMMQLNSVLTISDLNEEAVAAQLQQLERTRTEKGVLQSVLKSRDDRVSILEQCIVDLEARNARLYGTLANVVLPVLERLVGASQQASDGAGVNEALLAELPAQVLEALVRSQQVVAEVAGDGASEASPREKLGAEECRDSEPRRSGHRVLSASRAVVIPPVTVPEGSGSQAPDSGTPHSPAACKALSFESPARGNTVRVEVHMEGM
ncbi:hypothetical protein Agub_g14414 [Astrephomene gubernaculifera]|uniref:Uncharacterized protein n=1 Tax=Astrephomene gubernaculifera TaxID=47775 RepID=A0AAD3HT58_9CHLO|nr:hypothetical protein Agub_g14414 [Astrephomene gubernaculifera]